MLDSYKIWFEKYGAHILTNNSSALTSDFVSQNFSQVAWTLSNKQQYKQVKYVRSKRYLILTSMVGRSIKIFSADEVFENYSPNIEKVTLPLYTRHFKHQVVEVCINPNEKYAFFSLTDFGKEGLKDRVFCLDLNSFQKVFTIDTRGKWSKYIAYHPDDLLVISNWHSNDLSIIDVRNLDQPRVVQIIPCGVSPRGIAFTSDGNLGLVAGFYSRNLTYLKYIPKKRRFSIEKISAPFDYPNYSGNMRHVVIDRKDENAYISNMGRNLIHRVDLSKKEIVESYPCGSHPNTIVLSDNSKYLAVSCRKSNIICLLDTATGRIQSIVDTGPMPTGLDFNRINQKLYSLYNTNFEDDSIVCTKLFLP